MPGRIILKPTYGLANRLRTVAAALSLAEKTGRRLCVYWFNTKDCQAYWHDLFETPERFDVVEVGSVEAVAHEGLFKPSNEHFFPAASAKELVAACRVSANAEVDLVHENFKPFYKGGDYKWLAPRADIAADLERLRMEFGDHLVGVHIRRTDNREAIFSSPTELFRVSMEAELKQDGNVRFFLATDDAREKEFLKRAFPGKVHTRDKVAGRFEQGGIRDALIDLMLLSSCRKIYGTFWSSFSREAAKIGGGELVVLSDDSRVAVSVIVTLENSTSSCMRCLDSLLKQWLFRIEIICVNGGAPRGMRSVVDEYMKKDLRIVQAATVKDALANAVGKYVFCMSSNEVAEYNMTKNQFEFAEQHALDYAFSKSSAFFGGHFDDVLVARLNKDVDEIVPWREFHRKTFPGNVSRWLLNVRVANASGCNWFARTELIRDLGRFRIYSDDVSPTARTGVIAASFARRPVWSGNRESLANSLGDGKSVEMGLHLLHMRGWQKMRGGI